MLQGLAPRLAAAAIVADVVLKRLPLDEQFSEAQRHRALADLDPRDRALTRSIATVSLRRLGTIRKVLHRLVQRGLPKRAGLLEWHLVVAAAQILFLDVPDHAAVDLGVHAALSDPASGRYSKLANGVLRNIARGRDAILAASDPLDDDTPGWLAERWRASFGLETARAIAAAHRQEPTLDLTVAADPAGWAERLGGVLLPTGSVRLRSHQPVPEIEGFAEGAWWVQDAAATLPPAILRARPGERVADLCAAPGGKTATLAATGAIVTAVDRSAERMRRVAANLERLHLRADLVTADVLGFQAEPFDAVLLDAPCSATGTIRRHPDVAWSKRDTDITGLAQVQSLMLDNAARLVKPGGRLVFCTCSLEPEEGERQVAAFLVRNPSLSRAPVSAGEIGELAQCLTPEGDVRTLPSHLPADEPRLAGLDGFFAARLVRHG